jgi:hypothetical protein
MFLHFLLCAHVLCWFRRDHYPEEQKLRGQKLHGSCAGRRRRRLPRDAKAAAAAARGEGGCGEASCNPRRRPAGSCDPWCHRTTHSWRRRVQWWWTTSRRTGGRRRRRPGATSRRRRPCGCTGGLRGLAHLQLHCVDIMMFLLCYIVYNYYPKKSQILLFFHYFFPIISMIFNDI